MARLGLGRNMEGGGGGGGGEELKLSVQAGARVADPSNSGKVNSKYVVDKFGQNHPPVANEIFECMNCRRSIMVCSSFGEMHGKGKKGSSQGNKKPHRCTESALARQPCFRLCSLFRFGQHEPAIKWNAWCCW